MSDENNTNVQLLETIARAMIDGLITIDANGTIHSFNLAAERLFGYSAGEVIGQNVRVLIPEPDRSDHDSYVSRYAATREPRALGLGRDVEARRKDGTRIRLTFAISEAQFDDGPMFVGIARDVTELRHTQRSRDQSDARLAATLYSIGDGVLATDAAGRVTHLNRMGESLTGWSEAEAQGRPSEDVFRILSAETRLPADLPIGAVLASGTIQGPANDSILIDRDGMQRSIAASCAPIRGSEGTVDGCVLVFRDVSQKYAADRLLRQRTAELNAYRQALDQVRDGVFILEASELYFREVNDGATQQVGYSANELRRLTLLDLAPSFTRASFDAVVQPLLDGSTDLLTFDAHYRHRDGHVLAIEASLQLITFGGEVAFISVARDVTARNRWEHDVAALTAELTASERRYLDLFESAPDALVMTTKEGVITLVNVQTEHLFGYTRAEIEGQPLTALIPEGIDAAFFDGPPASSKSGRAPRVPRLDLKAIRKDGTHVPIGLRASTLDTLHGHRVLFSIRDITERQVLERQLLQKQGLERLGRLAAGVAHDFNNLLTVILGLLELNLRNPLMSPTSLLVADLQTALHAAQHAAALTQQLLAFGRKQVLHPRVVDLNQELATTLGLVRTLVGKGVTVVFRPGPELGWLRVDPTQLNQVVMNLAANARDAMPHGGSLVITTRPVDLDAAFAVHHTSLVPGHYIELTMTDSGSGMDPVTRERLFEPFYTTKNAGKGTGLGLSTVYGIVRQSGGSIWVESELGKGTVFRIYFPHLDSIPSEPRRESNVDPPAGLRGSETILVVEDDPHVRQLAQRFLEQFGYTVLSAASGLEALDLLDRHRGQVHLMITDVVMAGLSGSELVARVAAVEPTLKVLYTSGYTDDVVVAQRVSMDSAHLLHKPYSDSDLAREARRVLDM